MVSGELFVMISGIYRTLESCVGNLGMQMLSVLHSLRTLVLELVPYGWTMCNAGEMKGLLWIVSTEDGV